jgi:PadR family transcriptional regulator, regulatory protein PadR
MVSLRRRSGPATAVVLVLAEQPATWRYGYELCQRLGLKAGTLYPVLMGLADRGLLEATWEAGVPAGQPPRHRYRLTGPGRALAAGLAAAPPAPAKPDGPVGALGRRPRLEGT